MSRFIGILFVLGGVALLLANYGYIDLEWSIIWRYWPVLLILLGLNAIWAGSKTGSVLLLLVILGLGAVAAFFIQNKDSGWETKSKTPPQHFFQPMEPGARKARLDLTAVATEVTLEDSTSYLIDVNASVSAGSYALERIRKDTLEELRLMRTEKKIKFDSDRDENLDIKLNSRLTWSLSADLDAAAADLDLQHFYIDSIDLELDAVALDMKLGSLSEKTVVTIRSDASSIDLYIPEGSGCELSSDMSLSGRQLDDFETAGKNLFRTEGFEQAKQKIWIRIDADVSNLDVNRY